MIDKNEYEKGTRCKGMCCFCNDIDGCYQYIMNQQIDTSAKINLVARCECGYVFDHLICTENIRECKKGDVILAVNKFFEFQPNECPCCHKIIRNINYKTAINSNNPEIDFGYDGY